MKKVAIAALVLAGICLCLSTAGAVIRSGHAVKDHDLVPSHAIPTATRTQLLINPGFESGSLSPWTTGGWTVISSDRYSGTYSAQGITNIYIHIDNLIPFGSFGMGLWLFHPFTIVYAISGSAMISSTLRIPKP